ncbi:MAG: hypothetical protein K0R38_6897 [Polyangiaceae bacterium]|nr:hypothetical protein [Polyangiaceae bacterium]
MLTLSGQSATLATVPEAGCLAVGDELLLISLQGTPAAHDNVGNWELLRVTELAGANVVLSGAPIRSYGNAAGSNAGVGLTAAEQRVALVRVPRFGRLVVPPGVTVTADAWNGVLGGVVALRAKQLVLGGTVSAASLGYRGGRWSTDDITCSNSIQTESGESIGGSGTATTARNLGASGGVGAGDQSFNSDDVVVATPGHAQVGQVGFNPRGRTLGQPGAAYGVADGTRLTLGSGPGGALACVLDPQQPSPFLEVRATIQGGGVALLLVDDLQIEGTGAVTASPSNALRSIAASGGYVLLRGSTLALGTNRVTALGSVGGAPLGPFAGQTNRASPGYVVVSAPTVSGTTNPPAENAAASLAD